LFVIFFTVGGFESQLNRQNGSKGFEILKAFDVFIDIEKAPRNTIPKTKSDMITLLVLFIIMYILYINI
jgi:antibiotic biosynthesis monooxygenase (ABM) superfamily enzyme